MSNVFDKEKHLERIARQFEGKVVDESPRVAACVKGNYLGFPATIEAIGTGFPFGVNYYLVTNVTGAPSETSNVLTVSPKVIHGWLGIFSRFLLVDGGAVNVKDKEFSKDFVLRSNMGAWAKDIINHPGFIRKIEDLYNACEFSEFHYREGQGICVVRSQCLEQTSPEIVRETFRSMGVIAQVIFDTF